VINVGFQVVHNVQQEVQLKPGLLHNPAMTNGQCYEKSAFREETKKLHHAYEKANCHKKNQTIPSMEHIS
jgi:hypothetical protein